MARIRSIKPEFWNSADVCSLSRDARLLWIALWNFADDAGRGDARPKQVKIQVFPADTDIDDERIKELLTELHNSPVGFQLYEANGHPYFVTPAESWKHQKINKPQPPKYPAPTEVFPVSFTSKSDSIHGTFTERSGNIHGMTQDIENTNDNEHSRNVPGTFTEHSRNIHHGSDPIRSDRIGSEGSSACAREGSFPDMPDETFGASEPESEPRTPQSSPSAPSTVPLTPPQTAVPSAESPQAILEAQERLLALKRARESEHKTNLVGMRRVADREKAVETVERVYREVTGHVTVINVSDYRIDKQAHELADWAKRESEDDWLGAIERSYRVYLRSGGKAEENGYPFNWYAREPGKFLVAKRKVTEEEAAAERLAESKRQAGIA